MKVAIIGSNSFLSQYIIRELVSYGISPVLYGKKASIEFPELIFSIFKYPENEIDFYSLLDFDAIIYTVGAGIQANLKEPLEIIYELNSFTPIRLSNILATNNYKGKLLTFGSYFEIGNEIKKRFYTEDELTTSGNIVPNHYCSSKRLLSRYLSSSPQTPTFYHLILPNIYGVGENSKRLIPYLIKAISTYSEIKLTSGEQVRQYIHVLDIAKTVLDIINNKYPKGLYNLCQNEPVQIKELVKKIFVLTGNEDMFKTNNLFGSNERSDTSMPFLLLNNTKANTIFKYKPRMSLDGGIKTYLNE